MAGFSDRTAILKIGDGGGSEAFTAIAGLRDLTVARAAASVDTTNKDSSGRRTLLAARTKTSMTITGTGVFTDSATIESLRVDFEAGTIRNFQIDMVSTDASTAGETLDGAFQITQFEQSAPNEGEVNYTITLESSGAVATS